MRRRTRKMKPEAEKYQKLVFFKDYKLTNVVKIMAERMDERKKRREAQGKNYPYNCVSKYYPLANMVPSKGHAKEELMLPCGWMLGQSWGALKKAWKGYKKAKADDDDTLMREYAKRIQTIETQIGIPTASFPNLGMLGDIFFLYDKDKEANLRQKYMHDKILCDKYDVNNLEELAEKNNGTIIEYTDSQDLQKKLAKEHEKITFKIFEQWALEPETQKYFDKLRQRWQYRHTIKTELAKIKEKLAELREEYKNAKSRQEKNEINVRRRILIGEKIKTESRINSISATQLVRVDNGWEFCREIIKDEHRKSKPPDVKYTDPRYYLTDLDGKRLQSYKDDFEFRDLYLKGKYWKMRKKLREINIDNYDKIIAKKS